MVLLEWLAGIPPNDLIFKLEILAAEKPVENSEKSPNSVNLYAEDGLIIVELSLVEVTDLSH